MGIAPISAMAQSASAKEKRFRFIGSGALPAEEFTLVRSAATPIIYDTILYYDILYYTMIYYYIITILLLLLLYYTTLHYTTLHYTTLY